jgi:serine protease Do
MLLATISATAQAQGLAPDVLFEKVSPSVWVVQTSDAQGRPVGRGSAVVTAPGRLVTNCHVLAKSNSFVVKRDNVSYGATLEFPDPERDLCQIKVANFTAPAVELADINKLRVGAKVYAIGNPRGLEVTLSDGLISGLRKTDKDELEVVQTTTPLSPGSSGGGLFDDQGRLIGITTRGFRDSQNLNFAVPANWIVELAARGQVNLDKRHAPVAASVGGSAARPGVELPATAPLRVGDSLEYVLTDRFTNVRRTILYRVDKIAGDLVEFNQGALVERAGGGMIRMTSPQAGEMDNAMPPGGWGKSDLKVGQSWKLNYQGNETWGRGNYDLRASVLAESDTRIGDGVVRTVEIKYVGFAQKNTTTSTSWRFEATVWYSPDLGRVVRFESSTRATNVAAGSVIRERVELIRILRGDAT